MRPAITIWPGFAIAPDDVVLGVASSGLHSNGFSLARKIVFEIAGLDVSEHVPQCDATVGQLLLEPTRIYARAMRRILDHYTVKGVVHGVAHITGGGLFENLARILPEGAEVRIARQSWPAPPVFAWLAELGDVDAEEMDRVFNMGLGLAMVVSPYYAHSVQSQWEELGVTCWPIGRVTAGERRVVWS